MNSYERSTVRDLSANELDEVNGGSGFHPPNPVFPAPMPPNEPLIPIAPGRLPVHGKIPSPFPSPIIGPKPIA